MSLADQFRANALHEIGEDYVWGASGTGGVEGDDDYDCSGFEWAMLYDVGVRKVRTNAEGFRRQGTPISTPAKVGADFGVLLRSDGTAHHIAPYVGLNEIVEAKGAAYGVVKTTVADFNARGAKWYRFPDVDLGSLTAPFSGSRTGWCKVIGTMGSRALPSWASPIGALGAVRVGERLWLMGARIGSWYKVTRVVGGRQAWVHESRLAL